MERARGSRSSKPTIRVKSADTGLISFNAAKLCKSLIAGYQSKANAQGIALTLELALRLLETAAGARTTMQSPLRWSADASWKLDYNNIAQISPEELARRRAEFDRQKEIARGNRAA